MLRSIQNWMHAVLALGIAIAPCDALGVHAGMREIDPEGTSRPSEPSNEETTLIEKYFKSEQAQTAYSKLPATSKESIDKIAYQLNLKLTSREKDWKNELASDKKLSEKEIKEALKFIEAEYVKDAENHDLRQMKEMLDEQLNEKIEKRIANEEKKRQSEEAFAAVSNLTKDTTEKLNQLGQTLSQTWNGISEGQAAAAKTGAQVTMNSILPGSGLLLGGTITPKKDAAINANSAEKPVQTPKPEIPVTVHSDLTQNNSSAATSSTPNSTSTASTANASAGNSPESPATSVGSDTNRALQPNSNSAGNAVDPALTPGSGLAKADEKTEIPAATSNENPNSWSPQAMSEILNQSKTRHFNSGVSSPGLTASAQGHAEPLPGYADVGASSSTSSTVSSSTLPSVTASANNAVAAGGTNATTSTLKSGQEFFGPPVSFGEGDISYRKNAASRTRPRPSTEASFADEPTINRSSSRSRTDSNVETARGSENVERDSSAVSVENESVSYANSNSYSNSNTYSNTAKSSSRFMNSESSADSFDANSVPATVFGVSANPVAGPVTQSGTIQYAEGETGISDIRPSRLPFDLNQGAAKIEFLLSPSTSEGMTQENSPWAETARRTNRGLIAMYDNSTVSGLSAPEQERREDAEAEEAGGNTASEKDIRPYNFPLENESALLNLVRQKAMQKTIHQQPGLNLVRLEKSSLPNTKKVSRDITAMMNSASVVRTN